MPADKPIDPKVAALRREAQSTAALTAAIEARHRAARGARPEKQGALFATAALVVIVVVGMLFVMLRFTH